MPISAAEVCDTFLSCYHFEDSSRLKQFLLEANKFVEINDKSEMSATEEPFISAACTKPPEVRLLVGKGTGFDDGPLPISKDDFRKLFRSWQLSPRLLAKCSTVPCHDFFEYHFEYNHPIDLPQKRDKSAIKSLSIVFKHNIPPVEIFFILVYDIAEPPSANCLLSCGSQDQEDSIIARIKENADDIFANPPSLVSLLLANICNDMNRRIRSITDRINECEARLGVTSPEMREWLVQHGFAREPDKRYKVLNEHIYALQSSIQGNREVGTNLVLHAKALLSVLESYTDKDKVPGAFQDIHDVIRRSNFSLSILDNLERVCLSQASVLYNLISQRDSRLGYSVATSTRLLAAASRRDSSAMKTIAMLTLIFLPATFVSAIFSTSLFDFTSTMRGTGKFGSVSSDWWIYLLCCVLLTVFTVGTWALWLRWRWKKARREDREDEAELQLE